MLHSMTLHALYNLSGAIDLTPLVIHLRRVYIHLYVYVYVYTCTPCTEFDMQM